VNLLGYWILSSGCSGRGIFRFAFRGVIKYISGRSIEVEGRLTCWGSGGRGRLLPQMLMSLSSLHG